MEVVKRIKVKARASVKRIVLPEGDEPRTVEAARIVAEEGVAEPILLTPEMIARAENKSLFDAYVAKLYELRKAKGLTEEAAAKLVADPMYPRVRRRPLDGRHAASGVANHQDRAGDETRLLRFFAGGSVC